jgi:hypothetical protein
MQRVSLFFELIFRYYYVLNLDLLKLTIPSSIEIDGAFTFKILTEEDLPYFSSFNKNDDYIDLCRSRLKSSDFKCFAIIFQKENLLVHYSWVNYSNKYLVKELNKSICLKKKHRVLFEDDNTLLQFRGLKLHSYVFHKRINYSRSIGAKNALIMIYPRNKVALHTAKKMGFKRINLFPYFYRENSISFLAHKLYTHVFSRTK